MRIRWISPIIPPLVILSVFGLKRVLESINNRFSGFSEKNFLTLLIVIGLLPILINSFYILEQFKYIDPISYISGKVDRDEYIEQYRPEYPVIKYANGNLPEDAKILCVFMGSRRYYFERDVAFTDVLFRSTMKNADTPEKILLSLKKRHITHLVVNIDLFNEWANKMFDDREKMIINDLFQKNVSLLLSKGGYGLFRL